MGDDNRSRTLGLAVAAIDRAVGECGSKEELRRTLVGFWSLSLAHRSKNRWRRANVIGSADARPELTAAFAAAQDGVVAALVEILEPCRRRGRLHEGIDLASTTAWHYSLLSGRIYVEHGTEVGDPAEWDRLSLEALQRAFFGD